MPPPARSAPDPRRGGGVPARGPSPADNPRVLVGRYRLDSVIGKGSMGTVWAATDEILHRQVAIKEIDFPPGTPAAERAQLEHRTLREARAIAALSNPYVITLFDILTLPNGPVIVMELLHARSLAEILRKVGRLPDSQAATIGVAVASGLLAAHSAGITHRDVKPGNVLICDDGRIKLTDFGIARSTADQTMTATGLLLGSPAYIAPEVASGVPAGPISDAWSLGGLLFATTEGRPPFDQGTAIATLTSVVKDPVPPHPHSGRLGAVVSGLLVKTPALRMRIDRALGIMRSIADDPSGTNLTAVQRIPRDSPGGAAAHTATAQRSGAAQFTSGPQQSTGHQQGSGSQSAGGRQQGIGSGQHTGARPGTGSQGAGSQQSAPRHPPRRPAPFQSSAQSPSTQSQSPSTQSPQPAPTQLPSPPPAPFPKPATNPADGPGFPPGSPATSPADASTYPPGAALPFTGQPPPVSTGQSGSGQLTSGRSGSGQLGRPYNPAPTPAAEPLPPPPWASSDSATLAPLPATADERANHGRLIAAIIAAVIAAVIGFFGVRVIADLATDDAAGAAASVSSSQW